MIVVFNRLNWCFLNLLVALFLGAVQAEEHAEEVAWLTVDQVLEIRANAYCSMTEQLNQQCFRMSLAECSSLYQAIFATCDQLESDAFFDISDQSKVDQFQECYMAEFEKYLISKGLNLDEECE